VWLNEVLRFPLKPWLRVLVLAAGIIIAALTLLGPLLPGPMGGVVTIVVVISLWVLALRVASRLLLATASGAGLQREYQEFDLPEWQAARQIALWFVVLMLIGGLGQLLGRFGFGLGIGMALVLLPGMTLIVARNNALGEIFWPSRWQSLMAMLGRQRYRQLVMLLGGLALAYLVVDFLTGWLPLALSNGVMMALWVYLLWVWFYALGRELEASGHSHSIKPGSPDSTESLDELKHRLITEGGTLEEHGRLVRALELQADKSGLLEHGPIHVGALLLAYERVAEAVERAASLVALDPAFRLDKPSAQLALIRAACDHGHPELIVKLCAAYLKTWPAAPGCPEVRQTGRQALKASRRLNPEL